MADSDSDVILISSDDDEGVPSAQPIRNTLNSTSSAASAPVASNATSTTASSSASAWRPSSASSFAAFTSGQGSSAGPSRPPAPSGAAASAPVQKKPRVTESKKSRHVSGTSGLSHSVLKQAAASSSTASTRPSDTSQSHSGPSTRRNQQPQTYTELLHATRGHAEPVKPVQGAPKAVWDKYEEELAQFRQDADAIRLQAQTQQEEAEKKEKKVLQQIEAETVPGLHIRDLFWPDYEKLDKIAQYSAFLGEGPSMALRAQAVRAGSLSSILPPQRRLDECIRYWDAHAASYNGCIEFSVEVRKPSGIDPNTGAEYSWSLTVCSGHVPLHFGRGLNAWADYVVVKPAEGQEGRFFEKPASGIKGAHVTVAAGTDNEHAALPLHTPLMPEKYTPVGRGVPATATASASASASGMPDQPLHQPIASVGRGRGGRGGGIKAYWGSGRGGLSGTSAAAPSPARTPLDIDLLEGDLIIGIDDLDLRAVSGVDVTLTAGKGSLASDSAASMLSAGTTGSNSSREKYKSRAYELCVSHLRTHARVLLRVRRLTPEGRQNFFTAIMPSRPDWLHAVDESLLRQAIVRLLRGELIALKSFRTHGQQYMAYVARRIETAISHYESAAIREREEALQATKKYPYPPAWRAVAYSTGTGRCSSSPSVAPAASAPMASGGVGSGAGRKRKRSLSSAQEEWGGDEGGWEAYESGHGSGSGMPVLGTGIGMGTGTHGSGGSGGHKSGAPAAAAVGAPKSKGAGTGPVDEEDDPFADAFGDDWDDQGATPVVGQMDGAGGEESAGPGTGKESAQGSGPGAAFGESRAWPCGCSALKAMSETDPDGRPLNPHASPVTAQALVDFIMHEADLLLYGVNAMPESVGVGSGVPVPVLLRRGYVSPDNDSEELQLVEDAGGESPGHQAQRVTLPAASVHTGSVEEEEEEEEEQDGRVWRGLQAVPPSPSYVQPSSSTGTGSSFIQANTSAAAAATTATSVTEAQLDDTWATYPISQGESELQLQPQGSPQDVTGKPASTADVAGVGAARPTQSGPLPSATAQGAATSAAKGAYESSGTWATSSASGSAMGSASGAYSAAPQHHTSTSPPSQQVCDTCQLLDGRESSCDGALPSCNHCRDDGAQCTYAGVPGDELVGKTRGARAKGARAPRAPTAAAAVAAPT